ncbi:MAG: DNA polymerase ligase N-terminal domain-containing protein [Lacunisphaera sp.]
MKVIRRKVATGGRSLPPQPASRRPAGKRHRPGRRVAAQPRRGRPRPAAGQKSGRAPPDPMVRAHPVARAKPRRAPRALAAYHRKRDLRQSGEPGGSSHVPQESVPVFIVQKHDATRFALRFPPRGRGRPEILGRAKGLPMKTGGKALAIEVEDHPLDYGGFEGTIPAGNYGGGTVMLWDRGASMWWRATTPKPTARDTFTWPLAGEKLRGEWTLVRLRPRPGEKKTSWLIIRNHSSGKLPRVALSRTPRDRSVLSGRSMAESPRGGKALSVAHPARLKKKALKLPPVAARRALRRASSSR